VRRVVGYPLRDRYLVLKCKGLSRRLAIAGITTTVIAERSMNTIRVGTTPLSVMRPYWKLARKEEALPLSKRWRNAVRYTANRVRLEGQSELLDGLKEMGQTALSDGRTKTPNRGIQAFCIRWLRP